MREHTKPSASHPPAILLSSSPPPVRTRTLAIAPCSPRHWPHTRHLCLTPAPQPPGALHPRCILRPEDGGQLRGDGRGSADARGDEPDTWQKAAVTVGTDSRGRMPAAPGPTRTKYTQTRYIRPRTHHLSLPRTSEPTPARATHPAHVPPAQPAPLAANPREKCRTCVRCRR